MLLDMTAARRLAGRLESKYPDLTDDEKQAVIAAFEKDDPTAARGLKRVWGLAQ